MSVQKRRPALIAVKLRSICSIQPIARGVFTRGGLNYDRSAEPIFYWLTRGLNMLVAISMFVLALLADLILHTEWDGS